MRTWAGSLLEDKGPDGIFSQSSLFSMSRTCVSERATYHWVAGQGQHRLKHFCLAAQKLSFFFPLCVFQTSALHCIIATLAQPSATKVMPPKVIQTVYLFCHCPPKQPLWTREQLSDLAPWSAEWKQESDITTIKPFIWGLSATFMVKVMVKANVKDDQGYRKSTRNQECLL